MIDLPNIVSADDHVLEHPGLWQDRLAAKYRKEGPRITREKVVLRVNKDLVDVLDDSDGPDAKWCDIWNYDDQRLPILRSYASVGYAPEDVLQVPTTYDELRPGTYQLGPRLADMDFNGVDGSVCFPNIFVRFCGQRFLTAKDRELALQCVQAYNDWLLEEWEIPSNGRIIGTTIVPLWDAEAAAAEVRRNASRGARAVSFSEIPAWLDLPSLASGSWEPFIQACSETETVICIHIGSASRWLTTSEDASIAVGVSNEYVKSSLSLTDWLTSGIFVRYPDLKIIYCESQAGWIPYLLERLDWMWQVGNATNDLHPRLPELPSSYFHQNVYTCIFHDPTAIKLMDELGPDRILFETDYPHADGTWPMSKEVARKHFTDLPGELTHRIVRANAIKLFRFDSDKLDRVGTSEP
jgi:predicted TIM-barrel fold metal-dependent hydrolase